MLLRITLWAMLIGSVIMGYFGYQTGSAMTTFVGMGAIVFFGFLLFFLAKMTLSAGVVFIKVVIIILLIGAIVLLGIRGCTVLVNKGKAAAHTVSVSVQEKIASQVENPEQIPQSPSVFSKIKDFFIGKDNHRQVLPPPQSHQQQQKKRTVTSQTLNGTVSDVLSATTFMLNNNYLKLYGVDAPDLQQTCLTKRGETYQCGKTAKKKLEKLILKKNISCQLVTPIGNRQYFATCKIKGYDVGATMVSVGWAIADRRISDVYIPYEQQAHRAHEGLWAGKFVAPWDYRLKAGQKASTTGSVGFLKGLLK